MIRKFLPLAVFMAAAEAAASTGSAPAAGAEVPSTNAEGAAPAAKTRAPKNPDNKLDIINGRIPLPLVHLIRFNEKYSVMPVAAAAKAFGTSVGKVFDIRKNRNFGYIAKDYKPSAEEMASAQAWLTAGRGARSTDKDLAGIGGDPTGIKVELDKMGVATAEEVAARNWTVRTVGASAPAGQAPVAAPASGAAASAPAGAAAPAAAGKMF